MYVRVVRFTDVDAGRLDETVVNINESDGPPEGVPATGITLLHDASQGTAVVLQFFATAEDMSAGAEVLGAMDPADTPGTRDSVDTCEVKLEMQLP